MFTFFKEEKKEPHCESSDSIYEWLSKECLFDLVHQHSKDFTHLIQNFCSNVFHPTKKYGDEEEFRDALLDARLNARTLKEKIKQILDWRSATPTEDKGIEMLNQMSRQEIEKLAELIKKIEDVPEIGYIPPLDPMFLKTPTL